MSGSPAGRGLTPKAHVEVQRVDRVPDLRRSDRALNPSQRPKNGLNSSPNLPALCWPPVISPICRRLITLRFRYDTHHNDEGKKFLPVTFWKWISSVAVFLVLASAALLLPRDRSGL